MAISAAEVAKLRKMTDCGMMDCKKALEEAAGDMDKAVEILRTKGIAKAAKKAERVASEGVILAKVSGDHHCAVLLEVNSETDFVSRHDDFKQFADRMCQLALDHEIETTEILSLFNLEGETVDQIRQRLIAKIGENITLRRVVFMKSTGQIGIYVHGQKIGVLVAMIGGDEELAKDVAMHIAATNPLVITPDQLDKTLIDKERELFKVQALESGKPENIVDKMVEGRVKKYLNEVSLIGQSFVKNPDITVGDLLKSKGATVERFVRLELGEGIEKQVEDFAAEVMAQVNKF